MTNGEKIQSMFPKMNFGTLAQDDVIVNKNYSSNDEPQVFIPIRVWNAEYKEPTTRNCYGCKYSKDNHNAGTEECHLCMWENQYTPTAKNDLGVDCISRAQTQTEIEMCASRYTIARERGGMGQVEWSDQLIKVSDAVDIIRNLPPVTPQEPQTFKWCTTCKEYDQEKHCCHRWSKVIRDTVEEMKQEQEPCDKCEVRNPCLYCKHEFEPQESEDKG